MSILEVFLFVKTMIVQYTIAMQRRHILNITAMVVLVLGAGFWLWQRSVQQQKDVVTKTKQAAIVHPVPYIYILLMNNGQPLVTTLAAVSYPVTPCIHQPCSLSPVLHQRRSNAHGVFGLPVGVDVGRTTIRVDGFTPVVLGTAGVKQKNGQWLVSLKAK